eukprot:c23469_g1_i2 orf=1-243(-)
MSWHLPNASGAKRQIRKPLGNQLPYTKETLLFGKDGIRTTFLQALRTFRPKGDHGWNSDCMDGCSPSIIHTRSVGHFPLWE